MANVRRSLDAAVERVGHGEAVPSTEKDARVAALIDYLTRKVGQPRLPIGTRVSVRSFRGAVGTVVGPDGYPEKSALAVRMDPPYPRGFEDGYACVSVEECSVTPPAESPTPPAVSEGDAS